LAPDLDIILSGSYSCNHAAFHTMIVLHLSYFSHEILHVDVQCFLKRAESVLVNCEVKVVVVMVAVVSVVVVVVVVTSLNPLDIGKSGNFQSVLMLFLELGQNFGDVLAL
jgi:hypothetical protein